MWNIESKNVPNYSSCCILNKYLHECKKNIYVLGFVQYRSVSFIPFQNKSTYLVKQHNLPDGRNHKIPFDILSFVQGSESHKTCAEDNQESPFITLDMLLYHKTPSICMQLSSILQAKIIFQTILPLDPTALFHGQSEVLAIVFLVCAILLLIRTV